MPAGFAYEQGWNIGQPGAASLSGGGGNISGAREIAAMRAAASSANPGPIADDPNGYLASQQLQKDTLMSKLQERITQRDYQHGVHSLTKQPPAAYMWDQYVSPEAGIIAQAQGRKWNARGATTNEQVAYGGTPFFSSPQEEAAYYAAHGIQIGEPSRNEVAWLRAQRPRWS